jgi:hypothetical protein
MFLGTATLGTGDYTGQKRHVADALRRSTRPLTLSEIAILAILDGEYFKTLKDGWQGFVLNEFQGGGASGVMGSVEYHLKELIQLGEVAVTEP